ncbi:MAG: hypothetical protein JNK00_12595 [Flavipsychrobacter sp.]|nr:hypothetical protein [Flavipsychrobacter sp.]
MTKRILIAGVALMAIAFTSCKKDYTCTCTYANNPSVNSTSTIKTTKKDAETKCSTLNDAAKPVGGTCSLK